MIGKWLDLLNEVVPTRPRVAVNFDPANADFWRAGEAATKGKKIVAIPVVTRADLERKSICSHANQAAESSYLAPFQPPTAIDHPAKQSSSVADDLRVSLFCAGGRAVVLRN